MYGNYPRSSIRFIFLLTDVITLQAVDEVKEETTQLLEQIKILSSKNDDLRIEKERAEAQVKQLSEEVSCTIIFF